MSIATNRAAQARPSLLSGPILPALLGMALPTMVVLFAQTLVGVIETYFVGLLGTEALAGATLVFPVLMLMQMMANGGMGGGVAGAIARARGAGRQEDADALVWHSVVIAVVAGLAFTLAMSFAGPMLYTAMGGSGAALAAALSYSGVVFLAAILIWISALLSAALRGAGNMRVPGLVSLSGFAILVPLSPLLIFGWGPIPALGIAGGGVAILVYYLLATSALILYLRRPSSPLSLRIFPLQGRHFRAILPVGLLASVGTVQVNLTVVLVTAAAGKFGADAIAGYGIGSRLDYIQIPLIFAIGTAVLTMVGTSVGAGDIARARRIAWTGAGLAFALTQGIGIAVYVFADAWIGLFSEAPAVGDMARLYIHHIAPVYGAVGAGLALYFAGQGAGRVLLPVLTGTVRMVIAGFIGWAAVVWYGASVSTLFLIIAFSGLAYGGLSILVTLTARWGAKP